MPPGRTRTSASRQAWRNVCELMFSEQSVRRVHDACDAVGLTPGLMKALMSIQDDEARPMNRLAATWRCDASYVTSLVDGLELRGLVERRSHPTDRRAKTVALTEAGDRTREDLLGHLHEPLACFAALTAAEQRTLRDLLAKLLAAGGSADARASG